MKQGSTLVLKSTIVLIAVIVLTICVLGLPQLIAAETTGDFDYGIIFLGLYVPAVPFFFALHQALKILNLIDKNNVFSYKTVKALKNIKYCALIISGTFIAGMPYVFHVAQRDDAPGVAALGFVIIGASFVIATAAAVLEKLVENAARIKSENDLTV